MGEVEQRELRLTERNKVSQMDVINFGSNVRVEWSCPECKNKNEIGLPALFYAIQRRYMVECAACGDSFYVSANVSDRAAELPLERTGGTCPSCGKKYSDPDLPAGVAVIV